MARVRSEAYDDRRQEILDQAARLFAQHGFARSSISTIAKACDASKAWIYHYYESKEAILFDILHDHIRMLLEAVRGADRPESEPEARLRALVAGLLEAYGDSDDKHKVLLSELGILAPEQQQQIRTLEREIVALFAAVVADLNPGLAGGQLVKPVTMSLLGMLNWHFTWFKKDGPLTRDDYVDLVTRLFIQGVKGLP